MLSGTGKRLARLLKEIYDDKDFVCGVMTNANKVDLWEKIIDYINMSKRMGDTVTSDEILLLSIKLGNEL